MGGQNLVRAYKKKIVMMYDTPLEANFSMRSVLLEMKETSKS